MKNKKNKENVQYTKKMFLSFYMNAVTSSLHKILSVITNTLRSIVLHYIVWHYIVLFYIALHCTVLYCMPLHFNTLYCTVLYCIVLYCIVWYYIVLYLFLSLPSLNSRIDTIAFCITFCT